MNNKVWLRLLLPGVVWLALLAAPGVTLPGGERLGFVGAAAAQQQVNIDDFYDALDPFGQWVWHPRFGYVWLPENVSQDWRPYTVGHWEYTDEYGWYWDSREPFAWAVYHYGRWGYDDDYGWFWVPGDTWAPAWVQWRYSDDYVGWAPIGPRRGGYAYGVPVNYDPPNAESWVFVQPQYMTSRAISHYAVPIAGLGAVFIGATNVYRPQFRGGVVYNYGMPRDRVVQIIKRPIYVQKIYKVDNWKNGGFDKDRGIKIYAPGIDKDSKPERGPKRFADQPNDFKPKAKLKDTYKGDLPKGFGQSAKDMKSVVKEDGPDAFNKKHGRFAPDDEADRSGDKGDQDKGGQGKGQGGQGQGGQGGSNQFKQGNRDNDQGGQGNGQGGGQGQGGQGGSNDQNAKGGNDQGNQGKPKNFGGQGGPDQFKQGNRDQGDQGGQGKSKGSEPPPINKVIREQGSTVDQSAKGGDDQGNKGKPKNFGSQGGPDQFKQGNRDQVDQGGGGQSKNKNFGSQGGPNDQNAKGGDDQGNQGKPKNFGGPNQFQGGPNQFKQGNRDNTDQSGGGQGKNKNVGGPNGQGGPNQFQGGSNQFKQGNRNQDDQGGGKPKNFGGPPPNNQGGPSGANGANGQGGQGGRQGGGQAQGQGGQGGGGGDKKDKCQKHPEKPECQN